MKPYRIPFTQPAKRMLFLKENPEKRKQAKNAGLPAPRYKTLKAECPAFRYARGDVEACISLAALFTGFVKNNICPPPPLF